MSPQLCRVVLDRVVSPQSCEELILIARSLAVIGYREMVCSATIFEVAAACPALLPPLVQAREAVRAAVEEALGLVLGLLVEFTGLICWRPGSSIGWHHDANRPYLEQRAYSAVCYLNTAGSEFEGGTFSFQQGAPAEVEAAPGRLVAYNAQEVHSITPVTAGERFVLTLWFTEDPQHCEDTRLLAQLAGPVERPLGMPDSMWQLPDGTDLRLCRLAMAGMALVCGGSVIRGAVDLPDDSGAFLQLAVQPLVLHAWLAWHRQPLLLPDAGTAAAQALDQIDSSVAASSCTACLVDGLQFSSIQDAVLAVQWWAWQRCKASWGRECVCCTHLSKAAAESGAPVSCAWLHGCRVEACTGRAAAQLPVSANDLQQAAAASEGYVGRQREVLQELRPRWLQLGALFCDPDTTVP